MASVDKYDLPPHPISREISKDFGKKLTQDDRRRAYWLCALSLIAGIALQYYEKDWQALSRSGAVVTLISIMQVRNSIKWNKYEAPIYDLVFDVYTKIALDKHKCDFDQAKLIAKKRLDRVMPVFFQEIQRAIIPTQLAIAAIGTLVWGFSDLAGKLQ